jgi:uncharacterized protein
MHILVTGGTGFIGQKLCRALLASGHQVTVYSRKTARVAKTVGRACKAIDKLTNDSLCAPLDAIINLAGEPVADTRWSESRKEILRASRIETTQQIIKLCSQLNPKPKVLVSASAIGYYGAQGNNKVTEITSPHEEFTHRLCLEWEQSAMQAQQLGVRVAIARIGLVIGKGGFLSKLLPPFKLGLGGKLGSGQQWMPWIHILDLVHILLYLLEHETCHGVYNAVAPQPVTNADFTRILGKVVGRPTLFSVPKFVLESTLGEMSRLLLTGQQAIPDRLQKQEAFQFHFETLEDALRDVI